MCIDATVIKVSIYGLTEATPNVDDLGVDTLAEVMRLPHSYSDVATHRGIFHAIIGEGSDGWTEIVVDTDDRADQAAVIEALYDYRGPML